MKTLIVAEAGVNHNGDMDMARRLIDVAAESGADVVKFQTFRADRVATSSAATAQYQSAAVPARRQQELLRHLELDRAMHEELIVHAEHREIEFLSTAFDSASVTLLDELGMRRFKVPSGEITNLPYLRQIGALAKPVLLSSGMATLGEIEAALIALAEAGTSSRDVTVLHCNTSYPTPMVDVNLRAMLTLRAAFGVPVGYSDHTPGIEVAVAAVALGASVLEKHVTLDRSLPGPDHAASLEPSELAALVKCVRNIEVALGDGTKRVTPSEAGNRAAARKSIVAAVPISAGEVFTDRNVTTKRPGSGLSPMLWDFVMGRKASRAFDEDELIEL